MIRHILSVVHNTVRGLCVFSLPISLWWLREYIYFVLLSSSIGSINYYPLFGVRSWNNGVRCMFFVFLWGIWHNTHASVWSAIFQIWRESKYWSLKMCDCLYVTVHTQAQQSYVTVRSLLCCGSHTHFSPGLVRENKIVSALSNTPAIFTTV